MSKLNRLDLTDDIREKELPPVPSSVSQTLDQPLMETKSLRRKNFKKLSLDASPVKSKENLISNDTMDIREPTSLRQRGNVQLQFSIYPIHLHQFQIPLHKYPHHLHHHWHFLNNHLDQVQLSVKL